MSEHHLITINGGKTEVIDCSPAHYYWHLLKLEQARMKEYPQSDIQSYAITYSSPITLGEYEMIKRSEVVRSEPADVVNPFPEFR